MSIIRKNTITTAYSSTYFRLLFGRYAPHNSLFTSKNLLDD